MESILSLLATIMVCAIALVAYDNLIIVCTSATLMLLALISFFVQVEKIN